MHKHVEKTALVADELFQIILLQGYLGHFTRTDIFFATY